MFLVNKYNVNIISVNLLRSIIKIVICMSVIAASGCTIHYDERYMAGADTENKSNISSIEIVTGQYDGSLSSKIPTYYQDEDGDRFHLQAIKTRIANVTNKKGEIVFKDSRFGYPGKHTVSKLFVIADQEYTVKVGCGNATGHASPIMNLYVKKQCNYELACFISYDKRIATLKGKELCQK